MFHFQAVLQFHNNFNLMTLLRNNTVRKNNNNAVNLPQEISPYAINDLQNTIDPHNFLTNHNACNCNLCLQKKVTTMEAKDCNLFKTASKASSHWLKRLLDALCLSGAKTLKFNIPDILFVQKESLQTFQTSRKDGRLIKLSGTTPLKSLLATMVRLRKQYKYMLELNFNKKMVETIEPEFMHVAYFQRFVPSHFHDGMSNIKKVQQNKFQFKRYILHKNQKYEIQQIEEHKMNEKEPFCIVKYNDGNCQLFNQIQFEVYALLPTNKLQSEIVFVQSYIKYKLEAEAIYFSQYTLNQKSIGCAVDKRAESEVLVMIGGLSKYEQGYSDLQTIEELSEELMLKSPRSYVDLMTYKIVHYLSMTSRIYIDHIKIKWIMNDLGNIYLQEIMELQISEVPRRHIKYRLPPKDYAVQGLTSNNHFFSHYQHMKNRKHANTIAIRKLVAQQPNKNILQIMNIDQLDSQPPVSDDMLKTINNTNNISTKHTIDLQKPQKNQGDSGAIRSHCKEGQRNRQRAKSNLTTYSRFQQKSQSQNKHKAKLAMNKYFTISQGDWEKRRNTIIAHQQRSSMRYIRDPSETRNGSSMARRRVQPGSLSIACIE